MSGDDAMALIDMRHIVADFEYNGFADEEKAARKAVALIERLAAENARLTAEVERLTPREMTLEEIAGVFNEHLIHDRDDWDTDGCTVFCRHGDDRIEAGDATLMAQGLLRDAGPIVVQEPARGEGDAGA